MALTHILWRYMQEEKEQNIALVITHVHHGVRKESDEEEKMVRKVARDWGIPCLIHHFDSKEYAKTVGKSFQTAAREWRYARWQEDMEKENCTLLATAHHRGDQAETVLYRLLRGSGTAGLAGIYPQKGQIIRPLLTVDKEDIIKYCRNHDIPYALDYSNEEPIYTRNKIRLQLIPLLEKEYNPNIQEALARLAELQRWDEEYIEEQVAFCWEKKAIFAAPQRVGLELSIFKLPKALLSRLIRKAASLVTGEPRGLGYHYVEQVMASQGQVGWSQDLPGLKIEIDYQGVWFYKEDQKEQNGYLVKSTTLPKAVDWEEWITWQDRTGQKWQAGLFPVEEASQYQGECVEKVYFDLESLLKNWDKLEWRYRQEGDSLWLESLGHKSLKKIFQEGKIPARQRQELPLLALGKEILWLPGLKRGDRFAVKNVINDSGGSEQRKAVGILIKVQH